MQKKGALYNKLLYRKYGKTNKKDQPKENERSGDDLTGNGDTEVGNITAGIETLTLQEELQYLLYFKTCMIERDKDVLKIKMQQTIKLREATIRKREVKFFESFPFYFVSPDLVNIVEITI